MCCTPSTAQKAEPLQAGQNSSANNTITNTTELLYNMSQHARELIDEGDYEQALLILNKTLSIDGNSTDALTNEGRELYYLGQYDEAIKYFDKVIGIDPVYTRAINGKGVRYLIWVSMMKL